MRTYQPGDVFVRLAFPHGGGPFCSEQSLFGLIFIAFSPFLAFSISSISSSLSAFDLCVPCVVCENALSNGSVSFRIMKLSDSSSRPTFRVSFLVSFRVPDRGVRDPCRYPLAICGAENGLSCHRRFRPSPFVVLEETICSESILVFGPLCYRRVRFVLGGRNWSLILLRCSSSRRRVQYSEYIIALSRLRSRYRRMMVLIRVYGHQGGRFASHRGPFDVGRLARCILLRIGGPEGGWGPRSEEILIWPPSPCRGRFLTPGLTSSFYHPTNSICLVSYAQARHV